MVRYKLRTMALQCLSIDVISCLIKLYTISDCDMRCQCLLASDGKQICHVNLKTYYLTLNHAM